MTAWVVDWLRAFTVTVAVEVAVALPLLRRIEPRRGRRIAVVLLANLATHPLVWFLFPGLNLRFETRMALSELWAVAVEAGTYRIVWPALGPRSSGLISLLANGASLGVGLVLRAIHLL